jgi:hypothetical protein
MRMDAFITVSFISFALVVTGCVPPAEDEAATSRPEATRARSAPLREALTFHASFDKFPDADFARGDEHLYTAPSFEELDRAEPGIGNPDVEIAAGAGRFGSALMFKKKNTYGMFYRAENHVGYSTRDWSGAVSFWLSLTPEEDLAPGYCDPIQITDVRYNDAAVWVDFTRENPRQFRMGVFGDLEVWNPENIDTDQNPDFLNRLVVVEDPPFRRDGWTHVVINFSGLGSESGGTAKLYLNGEIRGTASDIRESFTWEPARAQIRVGVNYVGMFDELALFDRSLTDEEVLALYDLEAGIAELYRP